MADLPASAAAPGSAAGSNTRPPPRGTAAYPRKRAIKACQVCRARRTKCDNAKPSCSFCLKVGATCIQSPVDLSSFDPASLKILERLDDLEELVRSVSLDSSGGSPTASKTRVVESVRLDQPQEAQEPISLDAVIPQGPEDIASSWPIFAAFQDGLETAHALKSSSGPCLGASVVTSAPSMPVLEGHDPNWEPGRISELLDSFFAYVHVKNPVLDETATRNMVLSTVDNGLDWSAESCLTSLVCALGAIATPFGPSLDTMPGSPAYHSAQSFFAAAQQRIGMALCSDDTLAAQCLFLSGVYMMCTCQPVRAWRFFLQALAACQQFSFLHPPSHQNRHPENAGQQASLSPPAGVRDTCSPAPSSPPDTLQQAVYWSSWKSEREMRGGDIGHRLPDFSTPHQDAHLVLYPPFFPTPPAPRPETAGAPIHSRLARERTSWYFYLAEISLRRLSARVAAEMIRLRKQASAHRGHSRAQFLAALAEAVPGHEEEAREWIASLPACLSFDAPADEDDVCRFVLRGHAINLFELIYWPFLAAYLGCADAGEQPLSAERGPMLAGIVTLAQKALDHHLMRLVVNRPGYRHRHHGTIPMMRSCSRSALMLVATAKHLQREACRPRPIDVDMLTVRMPDGWAAEVDAVIDLLAFWSTETREFRQIQRVLERAHASTCTSAASGSYFLP